MNESIAQTTDITGSNNIVVTMCNDCGTTRTVARRAARVGRLRCATCKTSTHHTALDLGDDWREDSNRRNDGPIAQREALVRRAEEVGIRVRFLRADYGTPVEVRRYEGGKYDGAICMFVDSEISIAAQIESIKWAWSHTLTSEFAGPLCEDDAGLEFRGFYKKSA